VTDDLTRETEAVGESRRDLLKKAAVGGAVVWAAPAVLSGAAGAQQSPQPPTCFGLTTVWPLPNEGASGFSTMNGPILPTVWSGTNVDLCGMNFTNSPPWLLGSANWIDLVATLTTGSVTGSYTADCAGAYTLEVPYSRYHTQFNPLGRASRLVVQVFVNAALVYTSPDLEAPNTDMVTFSTVIPGIAANDVVTFTLTGTALEANNVGPAIGSIAFHL
jgi:hypothetical protein